MCYNGKQKEKQDWRCPEGLRSNLGHFASQFLYVKLSAFRLAVRKNDFLYNMFETLWGRPLDTINAQFISSLRDLSSKLRPHQHTP